MRVLFRSPGIAPLEAALVDKVVKLTLETPSHEATHWTVRAMAKAVGIAASSVVKIWHDHGLAPHRWRSFKLSNDKAFAEKLHDVVGLYRSEERRVGKECVSTGRSGGSTYH